MMQRSTIPIASIPKHTLHDVGEDTDDDESEGNFAVSSGAEDDDSDIAHHHSQQHTLAHGSTVPPARRAPKDLEADNKEGGSGGAPAGNNDGATDDPAEQAQQVADAEYEPEGMLPRDRQRRTTYYNERLEKQMSHVEAKQFYQNRQHAVLDDGASVPGSPSRVRTFSSHVSAHGGDGTAASASAFMPRSGASVRSRPSNPNLSATATAAASSTLPTREPAYRSALPVGLSDPNKHPDSVSVQAPSIGRFEGINGDGLHNTLGGVSSSNAYIAADRAAQAHALHPGLPHEPKPMLEQENIHGAGAGVGIESSQESGVTTELSVIYRQIQKILDLRHKYLRLSLQGQTDNPRDDPSWRIYPPMPEPVWQENKVRSARNENGRFDDEDDEDVDELSKSASENKRAPRKMGQNIGEDFQYEDCLPVPGPSEMTYQLDEFGVYQVYETSESQRLKEPIVPLPSIKDYYMALDSILSISSDGPAKSFAYRRLQYLEGKFNLYVLLNEYQEIADTKSVPHRDFYNVRKVDTHVHHSACMNQKHLLRFIKSKMKKSPDDIVTFRDDKHLTLKEVFESINLTAYDLSIDTLDMHAHTDSFHRFDKFNLKYNPIGESRLREIFLKTDNFIHGRYLAEITKEVIADLESSKYQMVEWRISVYGRTIDEWDKLAAWVVDNHLYSPNVRWLIQIPRLWDVYKSKNLMTSFEEVIVNIFKPLFEATADPTSHPKLHIFLQRVIGFDSVDDESKVERRMYRKFPLPRQWTSEQNPPYSYWIYYLFVNMASLNFWRKQRGFNTFVLRPHCGEAGDTDHLAAAVLCCHSISHGLLLRKVPLLQYIFYLEQIGVAMSPLSNNALFLAYERNPFLQYFKRGLNVSLSTDDPLQFAFTKEPLMEEYAVAAQIYKLSAVDMCELAKHSVVQSGFEHAVKQRWLGERYNLPGVAGNDVAKVNVPNIREAFRHETWLQEMAMVDRYTNAPASRRVSTLRLPVAPPNNHHAHNSNIVGAAATHAAHAPHAPAHASHAAAPPSPSASMKTFPSTAPIGVDAAAGNRPETSASGVYTNPVEVATPQAYYHPTAQSARQQYQHHQHAHFDLAHAQQDGGFVGAPGSPSLRKPPTRGNSGSMAAAQSSSNAQQGLEGGGLPGHAHSSTLSLAASSSVLDHAEPKYFPGVVAASRRRRESSAAVGLPSAVPAGGGENAADLEEVGRENGAVLGLGVEGGTGNGVRDDAGEASD